MQTAVENAKTKTKADFIWQMMPTELHITQKKRRVVGGDKIVSKKPRNIDDRLKVLEEKERNEDEKDITKASSDSEHEEEEVRCKGKKRIKPKLILIYFIGTTRRRRDG